MMKLTEVLLLTSMGFCHIVDDYYLQGWLASAKQKQWWENNAPDQLYGKDYLMALFMHSFSWSFMITLPLTVYSMITGGTWHLCLFICNILIHFITDNAKANLKKINLIQDQLIHMMQIFVTWYLWLFVL